MEESVESMLESGILVGYNLLVISYLNFFLLAFHTHSLSDKNATHQVQ